MCLQFDSVQASIRHWRSKFGEDCAFPSCFLITAIQQPSIPSMEMEVWKMVPYVGHVGYDIAVDS